MRLAHVLRARELLLAIVDRRRAHACCRLMRRS
jgi:hypothetical protein